MFSNQTLIALDIVRDDFFLPASVIELQKRDEFNKRLFDAWRNDKYLGDVLAYYSVMKSKGRLGGIEMHDHDVASLYANVDDEIQWQDLRVEDISAMTRAEKWKIVPYLRALGYWATIYNDDSQNDSLPFSVSTEPPSTQPSDYMSDKCSLFAPLAQGDYDLTPPTVPVRV